MKYIPVQLVVVVIIIVVISLKHCKQNHTEAME